MMDEGILREGRRGGNVRGLQHKEQCFFSVLNFKPGKTGCVESSFLSNFMPGCPVFWQISSAAQPSQSALILPSGELAANFDPV